MFFTVTDPEGDTFVPTDIQRLVQPRAGNSFYDSSKIHIRSCTSEDGGCPDDGTGFAVSLDPPNGNGAATITLKVTDSEGIEGAGSFAIRRQFNSKNPPLLAGIPNESVNVNGAGYGPVQFVVDDMDSAGNNDAVKPDGTSNLMGNPTAVSDNQFVVRDEDIDIQPTQSGRTFVLTVLSPLHNAGRAVITVTAKDIDGFKTDTTFVVNVIASGTPPEFNRDLSATWAEQTSTAPGAYTEYHFTLTDLET
jgi:hypothetical protein